MSLPNWVLLPAGAICFALANVGWALWPLAFICLVPLWLALTSVNEQSLRRALLLGLTYGTVVYITGYAWLFALAGHFIDSFSGALLLWSVYGTWFALGFAGYALCSAWLLQRTYPAWAALTLPLILLEAYQVGLFPTYLGAGFIHQPQLAQLASLGGPLLLSALAIAVNWLLYRAVVTPGQHQFWRLAAQATVLLLAAASYSYLQPELDAAQRDAQPVRVGLVQNNVVQATSDSPHGSAAFHRKAHQRNLDLSRELLATGPIDILVWPESAYSRALRRPLPLDAQMIRQDIKVPLLFGGTSNFHHNGTAASANSLFASDEKGRIEQVYDKQILLPFAETMPRLPLSHALQALLPRHWLAQFQDDYKAWIERLFPWHQNFLPGPGSSVLSLAGLRIATPICFELVHPDYVSELVRSGDANMIVSIANDSWFGRSQEPRIQLSLARLRAVEHGLWVIRTTNSGISAIINPRGVVVEQSQLFTEASLAADVHPRMARTPYSYFGNWVAHLAALSLMLVIAACHLRQTAGRRALGSHS